MYSYTPIWSIFENRFHPKYNAMHNTDLHNFKRGDIQVHYHKVGGGRPVLFIPGSISDYRTWSEILPRFSNHYACYAISRRFQYPDVYPIGGDSRVETNTEDIAAFIRDRKLAPVDVIGHSFGGYIALDLAIRYPDLVSSVVAEEPIYAPILARNPKNPVELLQLIMRNPKSGFSFARLGMKGIDPTFKALGKGDLIQAQRTFIDGVTAGKKTPQSLDNLTRELLVTNIASLAGEDPFQTTLTADDPKKISCPVLLIHGTESPFVFTYIIEQLQHRIQNASIAVSHGSSHWVHIDAPDQFVSMVLDFLSRVHR